MAKKVSLINMKGGVGKSTLAVNLAWHFAAYRDWSKNVLVVDLDPQFNASQYLLGVVEYDKIRQSGQPTVWDIFEQGTRTPAGTQRLSDPHDPIHNRITFSSGARIDLIPSRLELAFSLKNPAQKEHHLSKLIQQVEPEYDLIIIDCAPTESVLTTAAYLSSDYLLVPVKPEYLSAIGLPLLVTSMQDFQQDFPGNQLSLAGVVFNATSDYQPEEKKAKADVGRVAKQNGWHIFKAEVPYSRSFPKGAREGQPIFRTSYSRFSQIDKFNVFAKELASSISL